jgi:hypothetical protein
VYKEYNEARDIAPSDADFHAKGSASHHDNTIDAIANLATATAVDRTAVANLTDINAALTKQLAKSSEKLIAALTQVNSLTKQLSNLCSNNPTPANLSFERKHYCWTCGYRSAHSNWNCPIPAPGHQKRAKVSDTMNGSVDNKPS